MKYDEAMLKDALIDGCIRKLKDQKTGSVGTAYEQGEEYGKKHAKAPLTVPFRIIDDIADIAKNAGGELGRRQGERLSDIKANGSAVLGGKAAIEKRAAELQAAPVSDSLELGADFSVGYAMSATETFFDICTQNFDRGIAVANRTAEAFCAPLNIPVVKLPPFVDYGGKFVKLLRRGEIDAALALCSESKSEIEEDIPVSFVEYLRQKWGK